MSNQAITGIRWVQCDTTDTSALFSELKDCVDGKIMCCYKQQATRADISKGKAPEDSWTDVEIVEAKNAGNS